MSHAADARLLLFHKQGTSARTRFVRWPDGMLAFAPLPAGSALHEHDESPPPNSALVRRHPADLMRAAARRLGLAEEAFAAIADFAACLRTPQGDIPVLLVQFTTLDPPFAAVEALGGKFIAITEARDVAPLELQLLRQAYEILIG